MRFRALNTTLNAVILEASKNTKLHNFSILVSHIYHNDNMIHICSSKLLLGNSITHITMIHILPYMMYLNLLVKISLQVMDLNIAFKIHLTSKNTRNSDFRKTREIWFSSDISRSRAPYAPFFPLRTLILYDYRPQQPQPLLPRATHSSVHSWQPSRISLQRCL